ASLAQLVRLDEARAEVELFLVARGSRVSILPDDGADRIDQKARGSKGRQPVYVGGRIEIDKVESHDPRPPAEASDQV
ncbi:hypothetical protein ACC724_39990, partial [Rhizobium ruizarguesonis]